MAILPGDMVIRRDTEVTHLWEIVGVHLGEPGQESLAELRPLSQRPLMTPSKQTETCFVPLAFIKGFVFAREDLSRAITVTPGPNRVDYLGKSIRLGKKSFALFQFMHARFGAVVTHEQIYTHLYGHLPEADQPDSTGLVRTRAWLLREAVSGIGLDVETYRGQGYVLKTFDL